MSVSGGHSHGPELAPTRRQVEVLRAVFEHGSRKDAAAALGISAKCVRSHLYELYLRLGVETAFEAAHHLWLADLWAARRRNVIELEGREYVVSLTPLEGASPTGSPA